MMNSRRRRSPPRGRGSSRSLVWKWYQSCGSSLYELDLARVEGDRLLVRHRQDVVPAGAVVEVEDLRDLDPPGRLPQLGGRQDGHQHLLAADRVHLLADDLLDLPVDAPAERQERPEAGADLADEAAAHEQLVADAPRRRPAHRAGSEGRAVRPGRSSLSPRLLLTGAGAGDSSGISALGHGQRGRLRHLQALRAVHAVGDPPVDLVEQLVDQDVARRPS